MTMLTSQSLMLRAYFSCSWSGCKDTRNASSLLRMIYFLIEAAVFNIARDLIKKYRDTEGADGGVSQTTITTNLLPTITVAVSVMLQPHTLASRGAAVPSVSLHSKKWIRNVLLSCKANYTAANQHAKTFFNKFSFDIWIILTSAAVRSGFIQSAANLPFNFYA